MTWRFEDDTEVHVGGNVVGTTPFAEALRSEASARRNGEPVSVSVRPPPGGDELLDLNDPYHVWSWSTSLANAYGVKLVSGPKVTAPQDERGRADVPADAVY